MNRRADLEDPDPRPQATRPSTNRRRVAALLPRAVTLGAIVLAFGIGAVPGEATAAESVVASPGLRVRAPQAIRVGDRVTFDTAFDADAGDFATILRAARARESLVWAASDGSRAVGSRLSLRARSTGRLHVTVRESAASTPFWRGSFTVEPDGPRRSLPERRVAIGVMHWDGGETGLGRTFESIGAVMLDAIEARDLYREVRRFVGPAATTGNFLGAIRDHAARGDVIDVYLFGHGSPSSSIFEDGRLYGPDLREAEGMSSVRLVYTSNCWGAGLAEDWLAAGVRTVIASTDVNFMAWAHVLPLVNDLAAGKSIGEASDRRASQVRTGFTLAPLAVPFVPWPLRVAGSIFVATSPEIDEAFDGSRPRVFGDRNLRMRTDPVTNHTPSVFDVVADAVEDATRKHAERAGLDAARAARRAEQRAIAAAQSAGRPAPDSSYGPPRRAATSSYRSARGMGDALNDAVRD